MAARSEVYDPCACCLVNYSYYRLFFVFVSFVFNPCEDHCQSLR